MAESNWNIVIGGECMAIRPFAACEDAGFRKVIELLRDSDLTYAHLETNLANHAELDWPAKADWIASFMMADGDIADDLRWAGIDMMSLAHNHAFDFGASGIAATIGHCRRVGIACAGTGRDLEEAREPVYRETRKGRAALVSVSSGNKAFEWAGQPKSTYRGRPGVNPLRVHVRHQVDAEAMRQLRGIAQKLGIAMHRRVNDVPGELCLSMPESVSTGTVPTFVEGDGFQVRSACHRQDLKGNVRSIAEAHDMADLVMVAHHFNISDGPRGDRAPEFVHEFAHAAIDAGADIYVGHGWHRTLGIEIYNGKPILYGLGNLFAQSEFARHVPADSYEAWGHDMDRLPTLTSAAEPLHPGLDSPTWWTTVLFRLQMDGHRLREIRLYPVELGRDAVVEGKITRSTGSGSHTKTEGRPRLANADQGRHILARMQKISEPYGTRIEIEDNVGIVRL